MKVNINPNIAVGEKIAFRLKDIKKRVKYNINNMMFCKNENCHKCNDDIWEK